MKIVLPQETDYVPVFRTIEKGLVALLVLAGVWFTFLVFLPIYIGLTS